VFTLHTETVSKYANSFVQFLTVVRRSLEEVYNYGLTVE